MDDANRMIDHHMALLEKGHGEEHGDDDDDGALRPWGEPKA